MKMRKLLAALAATLCCTTSVTGYAAVREYDAISPQYVIAETASASGATLKSYLQGKPSGTYINFDTANGSNHSLVITATSSAGITVYEANSMLNDLCGVRYTTYTWDTFAKRFGELVHYVY